ncbi:hypothetical protein HPB47_021190, partial [Ixodes persulcatus]
MQQGSPYAMGPPPRKEVVFPPDSVEAVLPVGTKRRRLHAKDVSPLEAWRLMMCLKSGLLAESTWALDVLSVLLYDDATVLYFGLSHLPGLLETLMEHYRRCLALVFGTADDLEMGYEAPPEGEGKETRRRAPDRSPLLPGGGFTWRTRCGKAVRSRPDEEGSLHVVDCDKRWDVHEGFSASPEHWQLGGGEITAHIQTEGVKREAEEEEQLREEEAKRCRSKLADLLAKQKANCKRDPVVLVEDIRSKMKLEDDGVLLAPVKTEEVEEKRAPCNDCRTGESVVLPRLREEARPRKKRPCPEAVEEEAYCRDEPSLCVVSEAREALGRRCVCISTLLRNLSFMSKHAGLLVLLGRLLLLRHVHGPRRGAPRHYDQEECSAEEHCSSLLAEREWWWDWLQALRENTLVCLANMAGQLSLAPFPEEISPAPSGRPAALGHLPSALSPQRLALEALCKLSVQEANVDLLLATPPWARTQGLLAQLARWLARGQDQVLREFAVVLLSNVAPAGSGAARAVALQGACLGHLLAFVEQAEQSALQVANSQGVAALRDNPELMGTTLDMVRRAAATLRCLARVPDNRPLFLQLQPRLLALVMSQILDQGVAAILADVLFECSQHAETASPYAKVAHATAPPATATAEETNSPTTTTATAEVATEVTTATETTRTSSTAEASPAPAQPAEETSATETTEA